MNHAAAIRACYRLGLRCWWRDHTSRRNPSTFDSTPSEGRYRAAAWMQDVAEHVRATEAGEPSNLIVFATNRALRREQAARDKRRPRDVLVTQPEPHWARPRRGHSMSVKAEQQWRYRRKRERRAV